MGRNSYRNIEQALAVQARLKKREAFKQAEAEVLAVAAGKKPGSKAIKPAKPGSGGSGEIRIIGGQWRRTRLAVAQRPGLRPTPDRVRETLFNWLGQDMTGWKCVDAFAGTGVLGFEAASRGAANVVMNEHDASLVSQLQRIQQQLQAKAVRVQRGDGLSCLKTCSGQDLILLDPPFEGEELFEPALKAAAEAINDGGYIYLEAPRLWTDEQLQELGLMTYRHLKAGAVHAHLLKKLA